MAFTWTNRSRIVIVADSVFGNPAVAPGVSPLLIAMPQIVAPFGAPPVPLASAPFWPPLYKRPVIGAFDGAAGRGTVTIADTAPHFATFANTTMGWSGPFTHAVVQLGINDAANIHNSVAGWTVPTVTAAHLTILDGFNSIYGIPYANILTVGPWQRPADLSVEVPQVVAAFKANIALRGCPPLVDWSGISSAGGLSIGDQTHPSASGAALLAAPFVAAIATA